MALNMTFDTDRYRVGLSPKPPIETVTGWGTVPKVNP